jgi:hypothetical protein
MIEEIKKELKEDLAAELKKRHISVTPEELQVLADLQNNGVIRIPALGTPINKKDARRLRLFKGLVYKNLISFDIDFNNREYGFIRKNLTN